MDAPQQAHQEEDIDLTYWSVPHSYRLRDYTILAAQHLARQQHTTPAKLIDRLMEELANETLPPQLLERLRLDASERAKERQQDLEEKKRLKKREEEREIQIEA